MSLIRNLQARQRPNSVPTAPEIQAAQQFQQQREQLYVQPQEIPEIEQITGIPQSYQRQDIPFTPSQGQQFAAPDIPLDRLPTAPVGAPQYLQGPALSTQMRRFENVDYASVLPRQNLVEPFVTLNRDVSKVEFDSLRQPQQASAFEQFLYTLGLTTNVPAALGADIGRGLGAVREFFRGGFSLDSARDYLRYTAQPLPDNNFFINNSLREPPAGAARLFPTLFPFAGMPEDQDPSDVPNVIRALAGANFAFSSERETPESGFNPFGLLPRAGEFTVAQDLPETDTGALVRNNNPINLNRLSTQAVRILTPLGGLLGDRDISTATEDVISAGSPQRIEIPRQSDWLADRFNQVIVTPGIAARLYTGIVLDSILSPLDAMSDWARLLRPERAPIAPIPPSTALVSVVPPPTPGSGSPSTGFSRVFGEASSEAVERVATESRLLRRPDSPVLLLSPGTARIESPATAGLLSPPSVESPAIQLPPVTEPPRPTIELPPVSQPNGTAIVEALQLAEPVTTFIPETRADRPNIRLPTRRSDNRVEVVDFTDYYGVSIEWGRLVDSEFGAPTVIIDEDISVTDIDSAYRAGRQSAVVNTILHRVVGDNRFDGRNIAVSLESLDAESLRQLGFEVDTTESYLILSPERRQLLTDTLSQYIDEGVDLQSTFFDLDSSVDNISAVEVDIDTGEVLQRFGSPEGVARAERLANNELGFVTTSLDPLGVTLSDSLDSLYEYDPTLQIPAYSSLPLDMEIMSAAELEPFGLVPVEEGNPSAGFFSRELGTDRLNTILTRNAEVQFSVSDDIIDILEVQGTNSNILSLVESLERYYPNRAVTLEGENTNYRTVFTNTSQPRRFRSNLPNNVDELGETELIELRLSRVAPDRYFRHTEDFTSIESQRGGIRFSDNGSHLQINRLDGDMQEIRRLWETLVSVPEYFGREFRIDTDIMRNQVNTDSIRGRRLTNQRLISLMDRLGWSTDFQYGYSNFVNPIPGQITAGSVTSIAEITDPRLRRQRLEWINRTRTRNIARILRVDSRDLDALIPKAEVNRLTVEIQGLTNAYNTVEERIEELLPDGLTLDTATDIQVHRAIQDSDLRVLVSFRRMQVMLEERIQFRATEAAREANEIAEAINTIQEVSISFDERQFLDFITESTSTTAYRGTRDTSDVLEVGDKLYSQELLADTNARGIVSNPRADRTYASPRRVRYTIPDDLVVLDLESHAALQSQLRDLQEQFDTETFEVVRSQIYSGLDVDALPDGTVIRPERFTLEGADVLPDESNPLNVAVNTYNTEPTVANAQRVQNELLATYEDQYSESINDYSAAMDEVIQLISDYDLPETYRQQALEIQQRLVTQSYQEDIVINYREDARLRYPETVEVPRSQQSAWNTTTGRAVDAILAGDPDELVATVTVYLNNHRTLRNEAIQMYENYRSLMIELFERHGRWMPDDMLPDLGDICNGLG